MQRNEKDPGGQELKQGRIWSVLQLQASLTIRLALPRGVSKPHSEVKVKGLQASGQVHHIAQPWASCKGPGFPPATTGQPVEKVRGTATRGR